MDYQKYMQGVIKSNKDYLEYLKKKHGDNSEEVKSQQKYLGVLLSDYQEDYGEYSF